VTHRFDFASPEREFLSPEAVTSARRIFHKRILCERLVHRWPGNISTHHKALVQVIRFDQELADLMSGIGKSLFDWLGSKQPPLPEDLCLFRVNDRWPTLVSVTHERDAWILSRNQPSIERVQESSFSIDELLIPHGDPDFLGDQV